MSRTGDLLDSYSGQFDNWFAEPLTVRNFVAGAEDDYGDAVKTLDSEVTTQGQVERPDDPREVSRASGQTTTSDVEILISDDVFVTDGTDANPYPSEIVRSETGTVYTVFAVFSEDNGLVRVDAVNTERE